MAGPNVGAELEKHIARLQQSRQSIEADWEADKVFLGLALVTWPTDVEGAAMGRQSNRARMRLRYEGFRVLSNALSQVEALRDAAQHALDNWGIQVVDDPQKEPHQDE